MKNGAMSIGEAAKVMRVPVHTLRYWEREFGDWLRPRRTAGGQRRYTPEDLAVLLDIRWLLKEERMTVEGAKKRLRGVI